MQQARLMRSETDRMLAGVCGGLADYLGIDPVLVRLAFVILFLASGVGLAIYVLLWIILPTPSRAQPTIRLMDEGPADPTTLKSRLSPAATIGAGLILFGAFFLLQQSGWLGGFLGGILPFILIGAGLFYLIRRGRQS